MIARFFLVCLGGALGSGARYATSLWAAAAIGTAFPFGTLIVNVLGSFLLGFLMQAIPSSSDLRLMLTTGVMGGFTTYSTFNYETTEFLREGAWPLAAANILGTVAICLAAGFAGAAVARMIVGR